MVHSYAMGFNGWVTGPIPIEVGPTIPVYVLEVYLYSAHRHTSEYAATYGKSLQRKCAMLQVVTHTDANDDVL